MFVISFRSQLQELLQLFRFYLHPFMLHFVHYCINLNVKREAWKKNIPAAMNTLFLSNKGQQL